LSDTSDLNSTAFGDAVADGMTTVWALPCGYSFRYASISAGNNGGNGAACRFDSFDDELDAVAGLDQSGNGLSIYHSLPYGASAGPDLVSFSTNVRTADLYFLLDTTGSMGGSLSNLQIGLTSGTYVTGCPGGIIGGVRCIIPDAWFGVGRFDDFAVSPYGQPGIDVNYQHVLNMTSDAPSTSAAVNALTLHYGNDGPEIQVPSLWAVATGRGIAPYWAPQTSCTAGSYGFPCFRPGTIPIVMMFTDAEYHNGAGLTNLYDPNVLFGSVASGSLCSTGPAGTTYAFAPTGTGAAGGPVSYGVFSGAGTGGGSGATCFGSYSFPTVAGVAYTVSTCGTTGSPGGPVSFGPYSGSGAGGGSGASCIGSYSFPVTAGGTYTISTCGSMGSPGGAVSFGPYSGSGSGGGSGATCFGRYSFPTVAGATYTISTCGGYSGDTWMRVDGTCVCANDDSCGLGSACSCTATSTGTATICASTWSSASASWNYVVTGTVPATAGTYSGDPWLRVDGACTCSNDDSCGTLASSCTCTAASTGTATICASTFSSSAASWNYTVNGTVPATVGTYSGDPYVSVSGSCVCANDDACGTAASECTCIAGSTGISTICASTFSSSAASWNYRVTGTLPASTPTGPMTIPSSTAAYIYTGNNGSLLHNPLGVPCAADSTGGDATFLITIPTTKVMHFDTLGSTFDTGLAVYNSSGTSMACSDDCGCAPNGAASSIEVNLVPGTYTIVLGGFANQSGSFMFHSYPVATVVTPTSFVPQFTDAVNALNAIGAKIIVIDSSGGYAPAVNQGLALTNATGSLTTGGAPAVYSIASNGTGLGATVVNAVRDLANYSRMDVTALAIDNPATPVDERCFVNNPVGTPAGTIRLSNPAIGESAPYASGRCIDPPTSVGGVPTVARQCLPGSQVNFRASFTNDCVTATAVTQTFTFNVVTYGNGSYVLGTTPVTIIVPAFGYPPTGTFTNDVDGTTVCAAGEYADWSQVQLVSTTPAGTSIRVDVQTAATAAALGSAPIVTLGTVPPAVSPLDIRSALAAALQPGHLPALRVTFTLNADATRTFSPTVAGFRVLFDCVAGF
ncbi:MAG: pre-peptidase C-terminal domain-containing protein, partial [Deltaproteobacteria bacterium]